MTSAFLARGRLICRRRRTRRNQGDRRRGGLIVRGDCTKKPMPSELRVFLWTFPVVRDGCPWPGTWAYRRGGGRVAGDRARRLLRTPQDGHPKFSGRIRWHV